MPSPCQPRRPPLSPCVPVFTDCATAIEAAKTTAEREAIANTFTFPSFFIPLLLVQNVRPIASRKARHRQPRIRYMWVSEARPLGRAAHESGFLSCRPLTVGLQTRVCRV